MRQRLSHCLIVSAGVWAGIRISTHLTLKRLSHCLIVSSGFFPPGLEGAPLRLLISEHEVSHFDEKAALAAHHPDLLELGAELAHPVAQVPHLLQGGRCSASQRHTRSRSTFTLMKGLPRVEVLRQETNLSCTSDVVCLRPKSFGSSRERSDS